MKNVLVTGGLGYIGSHTSINLLRQGFNVLIIDSLENSSLENLEIIKKIVNIDNKISGKLFFEKGNICNKKWLDNVFLRFSKNISPIDSVIHFAGLKSVKESIEKPIKYWDVNLNSSLSLFSIMEKNNCGNLVFSSSATIYKPKNVIIDENSALEPVTPYGKTKLAIENILIDMQKSKPSFWKIACLRYFNPVGCHHSGLLGESMKGKPNNLFPALINVIRGNLKKLSIYGSDWPTPDGTCIRDYIHVMDAADAHISALYYLDKNKPQIININIGTGVGTSLLELIENFNNATNYSLPFDFADRRKGDLPYVVSDISLAIKLLNWRPKKSMDQICKDTWNYIQNS